MSFVKKHKDLDSHIENVYNFKKLWNNKCSIYYDDVIKAQPSVLPKVDRIIVIGDIHGDWSKLIESLKIAKVIDDNDNWIGGDTVVVQVGDQIDRCRYTYGGPTCDKEEATENDEPNDWKILKYFTKLHNKAMKKGGAVYSLIGNHELMNVDEDFRYVSYQGLREFDNYKKPDGTIISDGDEARRWAFKPGNPISEFLACTRQVALIIGSNLFVHAGILPKLAKKYSVNNINNILSLYFLNEIKTTSDYKDIFHQNESPLWTREFGNLGINTIVKKNLSEDEINEKCSSLLKPINDIYKVDKIYVGHTPMLSNGISNICNGKIWLTDYGSSQAFDKFETKNFLGKNNPRTAQVLEILNDGEIINILK